MHKRNALHTRQRNQGKDAPYLSGHRSKQSDNGVVDDASVKARIQLFTLPTGERKAALAAFWRNLHARMSLAALLACGLVAACGRGNTENEANVTPPPPIVTVAAVRATTVPITEDYQATIGSIESVQLRARVQGTLDRAPFKEGDLVQKGELVYQIQQNEYIAALEAAQGQLATARGNLFARQAALTRANIAVARNRPLAADKAIPQKELDNAVQTAEVEKGNVGAAQAQVLSAQAAVDTAKINLGYTTISAPVTGLIGFSNYDVGNVVGGTGTEVLNTVSVIDPIKVTFALDEPTFLALAGGRHDPSVEPLRDQDLRLILANDTMYNHTGKLYAFSPTVDPKTGTMTVETRFINPDGLLRPGGFARIRVVIERRTNALLVPQTAITKSQGVNTVYVINKDDEADLRSVTLGPAYQQSFVVDSGLNAGDRVVVQGTQKVLPGKKVQVKSG
jgi:membrane fusion protein (multidrug efflux system)